MEIPLVAANVSRVIPARQMQIWAVLREGESVSRTVYSLCAAMMGRICLSGDVLHLGEERVRLIQEGLEFYQAESKTSCAMAASPSSTTRWSTTAPPKARQVYLKEYEGRKLVIVHFLESAERGLAAARRVPPQTRLHRPCLYGGRANLSIEGRPFAAGAFLLERI